MTKLIPILSNEAPSQRNALWIKPVEGGFVLYIMEGGRWLPQKQVEDNHAAETINDTVQNLIGKTQDSKNKNTIYGAKNYAKDQANNLKGSASDTSADLTLYGLKKYIDEKIAD